MIPNTASTLPQDMTAEAIINHLDLQPHPEGGYYRETWREQSTKDKTQDKPRPSGTCIYFLLKAGESSHWHRVDAAEIWHFYSGAPLILSMAETKDGPAYDHMLGPDLLTGQAPQIIVPPHHWQAARSTGSWTLVGCTVSPGFLFEKFELAAPDMHIPSAPQ